MGYQNRDQTMEPDDVFQDNEMLFRSLVDMMDEAVCVVERLPLGSDELRGYRYISMNPAMQNMFGISDLSGQSMRDNFPDEAEHWYDDYDQVLDTGQPTRIERTSDSRGMLLDVSVERIKPGRSEQLMVVMRDVTERKRVEDAIRENADRAFLLELSDELRPLASATDIQALAMARLAERLEVVRAGYYEVAADEDTFTLNTRWEKPGAVPLPDRMSLENYGPNLAERYRAGRNVVIRDTELDEATADHRAALRAIEVRAWIGAPLVKEGRLIGGVGVQSDVPRDWTPAEIRLVEDVVERTWASDRWARAEAAVRDREERLRALVDATSVVIYSLSPDSKVMNHLDGRGYLPDTITPTHGWLARYVLPEDQDTVMAAIQEGIRTEAAFELEHRVRREDGSLGWIVSNTVPIRNASDQIVEWFGAARDVTEHRQALKQLSEQQRLEIVGRLSGAIAHDFNNQLLVIMNNIQLAQMKTRDAEGAEFFASAMKAAEIGKSLIQRLVIWSGESGSETRKLDLNGLVNEMSGTMSRLLENRIAFSTDLAADLWPVSADPVDVDNAILNLVLNARDATTDSGEIRLTTANIHWMENDPDRPAELKPGDYVRLSVDDTGSGMTEEVKARVLEPFFTTKSYGTGLGLFSIRKAFEGLGGFVELDSEPRRGTCVRLYIPRLLNERALQDAPLPKQVEETRTTLLLVEDEPAVRKSARRLVEAVGYRVIEATDASDALSRIEAHGDIRIVMSDISMPGKMDGRELARHLSVKRPDLGVVLTTGFNLGANPGAESDPDSGALILGKPYRIAALKRVLEQALTIAFER